MIEKQQKPVFPSIYLITALLLFVSCGRNFYLAVQAAGGLLAIREDVTLLPISEFVWFALLFIFTGIYIKIYLKTRG